MAGWKGHLAGGLGAGAALATVTPLIPLEQLAATAHLFEDWQALTAIFVLCMLFALFPDVDTNSKAQDIFFVLAFVVDVVLILNHDLQAAAYLGLIAMLPILGHHRGWTHRRWAMVIVPLPILIVPYLYSEQILPIALVYYGSAVAGYFSHLLLDGRIISRIRVKG
jgi:membrane-bound metal-dependent hydrolase YbcI (DUF457 family)